MCEESGKITRKSQEMKHSLPLSKKQRMGIEWWLLTQIHYKQNQIEAIDRSQFQDSLDIERAMKLEREVSALQQTLRLWWAYSYPSLAIEVEYDPGD